MFNSFFNKKEIVWYVAIILLIILIIYSSLLTYSQDKLIKEEISDQLVFIEEIIETDESLSFLPAAERTLTTVEFSYPLTYRLEIITTSKPLLNIIENGVSRIFDSTTETRTVTFTEVANTDTSNYCEIDTNTGLVTITADVNDEVSCEFQVSIDETGTQTSVTETTTLATRRPYYTDGHVWNNEDISVALQNVDILPEGTTYGRKSGGCRVAEDGNVTISSAGDCVITINAGATENPLIKIGNSFTDTEDIPESITSHNGELYMIGSSTSALYRIDTEATGNPLTRIGTTFVDNDPIGSPVEEEPFEIVSHNGELYMVGIGSNSLYRLDTEATGNPLTLIGETFGNRGLNQESLPESLASHSDGELYLVGSVGDAIYRVDTEATGNPLTRIGTSFEGDGINQEKSPKAIVSHSDGELYIIGASGGALYRIDTEATGNPLTRIGTSFKGEGINLEKSPISLASHNGDLYMIGYGGDAIYKLDTETTGNPLTNVGSTFTDMEDTPLSLASHNGELYMVGIGSDSLYKINTEIGNSIDLVISTSKGELSIIDPVYPSPLVVTTNSTEPTTLASTIPEYTGTITYSTSTTDVCSVADTTGVITPKTIGICIVIASFTEDSNWNARDSSAVNVTIEKALSNIIFSYPPLYRIGGEQTVSPLLVINGEDIATTKLTRLVSFSEVDNVDVEDNCSINSDTGVITVTGVITTAGATCRVSVEVGSSENHLIATETATLNISGFSIDFSGNGRANTTDALLFYIYALFKGNGFSAINNQNILEKVLENEVNFTAPGSPRLSDSKEDVYALLDRYSGG